MQKAEPPTGGRGSSAQPPQAADIHGLEGLTNAIDQNAEDHDGDQDIEQDAQLDNQRHSVSQGNGGQEETVFQAQQGEHLGQSLAPVDHHEETDQEERNGHGYGVVAQGGGAGGFL